MKNLKLYFFLLVLSIILLIAGFFSTEEILDINVHDTYYVIGYKHFYYLISIFSFLLFLVYWIFDKIKFFLLKKLIVIHVFGTLLSVLGLCFPYYLIFKTPEFQLFDNYNKTNLCLTISAIFLLVFQLVFLLNILITLIKKMLWFLKKR
jgi:heme/copper-type cytochrome/quinol oxidase subunit 1